MSMSSIMLNCPVTSEIRIRQVWNFWHPEAKRPLVDKEVVRGFIDATDVRLALAIAEAMILEWNTDAQ